MAGEDLGDLVACGVLGKSSCSFNSEPLDEPENEDLGAAPPTITEKSLHSLGSDCPGLEVCSHLRTND